VVILVDSGQQSSRNWFIGDNQVQFRLIGKNNPWWN